MNFLWVRLANSFFKLIIHKFHLSYNHLEVLHSDCIIKDSVALGITREIPFLLNEVYSLCCC